MEVVVEASPNEKRDDEKNGFTSLFATKVRKVLCRTRNAMQALRGGSDDASYAFVEDLNAVVADARSLADVTKKLGGVQTLAAKVFLSVIDEEEKQELEQYENQINDAPACVEPSRSHNSVFNGQEKQDVQDEESIHESATLRSVVAKNFLSFDNFMVEFDAKLCLVVGANDVGKSNIARVIRLVTKTWPSPMRIGRDIQADTELVLSYCVSVAQSNHLCSALSRASGINNLSRIMYISVVYAKQRPSSLWKFGETARYATTLKMTPMSVLVAWCILHFANEESWYFAADPMGIGIPFDGFQLRALPEERHNQIANNRSCEKNRRGCFYMLENILYFMPQYLDWLDVSGTKVLLSDRGSSSAASLLQQAFLGSAEEVRVLLYVYLTLNLFAEISIYCSDDS